MQDIDAIEEEVRAYLKCDFTDCAGLSLRCALLVSLDSVFCCTPMTPFSCVEGGRGYSIAHVTVHTLPPDPNTRTVQASNECACMRTNDLCDCRPDDATATRL